MPRTCVIACHSRPMSPRNAVPGVDGTHPVTTVPHTSGDTRDSHGMRKQTFVVHQYSLLSLVLMRRTATISLLFSPSARASPLSIPSFPLVSFQPRLLSISTKQLWLMQRLHLQYGASTFIQTALMIPTTNQRILLPRRSDAQLIADLDLSSSSRNCQIQS
jgi:hypothetical protein